jgi:hypothetical protein
MKRKCNIWLLDWSIVALGLLITSSSVWAAQSESPVACNELLEPLPLVYGDHTTGCEINPVLDIDRFVFDGASGDEVRIVIRTFANQPDPRLEVRDPDGAVIFDSFCGTNTSNPCTLVVNLSLVKSGPYQLAMSDQNNDGAGSYTMQLEKFPPVTLPQDIVYNVPAIIDEINPVTDTDYFSFYGVAGTDIRFIVSTFANQPDPHLVIWDPAGTVIQDSACGSNTSNPCTISRDLNLTLSGSYLVFISDESYDGAGSYQVSLQCLFGPCPPAEQITRPECDIQMLQTSYIDGETVTIDVMRFANQTSNPISVEMKMWLGFPNGSISVINVGADGAVVLPAGFDRDLGPAPLFVVSPSMPRGGGYEFGCRMLDPVTGRLLMEDREFFELQ